MDSKRLESEKKQNVENEWISEILRQHAHEKEMQFGQKKDLQSKLTEIYFY